MGYEKDVAAIVKAIEDHKKAATYDPIALVKQTITKKPVDNDDQPNVQNEEQKPEEHNIEHPLTKIFLSKGRQTILLSATLTKVLALQCFFAKVIVKFRATFIILRE